MVDAATLPCLAGGGETGALIRAHDWAATPLGPPDAWPPALRTAVSLLLTSAGPVYVAWGPDLTSLYNDGYLPIVGGKHPGIGLPFDRLWPEIWDQFRPIVAKVMAGEAQHFVDLPIALAGRPDVPERFFTFSYTPLVDEAGAIAGFYCAATETTERVLSERRRAFRLDLERQLADLTQPRAIMDAAVAALGRHLGANRVGYSESRDDDLTIDFSSCYAEGVAPLAGAARPDDFGPLSIAKQRRGETEAVADVEVDPAQDKAVWQAIDTRAFVSVPLVREGRFRASLYVNRRLPHRWTDDEVLLIEEVASRTWAVVERARAEHALQDSQARFRSLFESMEEGYYRVRAIFDVDGLPINARYIDENPAAVTISGRSFIGRTLTELGYADPFWHELFGRVARTGEPERFERPDAREDRWFELHAFKPADAASDEMAVVFRDVSSHHRSEAALRESEERLRFLSRLEERLFRASDAPDAMQAAAELLGQHLAASRCAYADVDADTDRFWIRSDYTAPGMASSAGEYSLDLFGSRAAADMRSGRTLVVRDVAGELAAEGGAAMFQAIDIEAIICCPLVKDGRLAAMMAVHQNRARDWTGEELSLVIAVVERCWAHVERVGAEARLRESEERLRLAVDNADVGFWDVDVINDRLIWPARTKAMFGIAADTPVSMRDFYDGLHPDDLAMTGEAYAAAADPARRALYDVEYRTVGATDGIVRWVAAKGRGVFDASGRCLRVAGTAVEITARKQAEAALHELNATLETRVTEAVAEREAAQEALRQSQKMEAIGQLTGGVAHDFNNLLTPIVGSLDLLARKGLGGEREQRLIAGAAQAADRARVLVQRLLAFARRQPLQPVAIDMARLVSDMGDLIASTTGPQIKVVVDAADDLPPAQADPNQLEMALLNLAVNARDAMPDGGTLRISVTAETVGCAHRAGLAPGDYLRLSVADTGSGMDEATLARAIEPFFSTKGVGRGTGLGLSMVHGLASQLGGALTIQSTPGLGTNIELWLPRSTTAPATARTAAEPAASSSARGTVLLVDDEELVRMSTADMLAGLGFAVREADSAEAALRLIDAGLRVDLLVTDHLMPGITGTELAQRVLRDRPGTPVLLVSGYTEGADVDPSLPRLVKPFRADELAAVIERIPVSHDDRAAASVR